MTPGSLFLLFLVALFFVAVAVGAFAWILIPLGVIVVAAIFFGPVLALIRKAGVGETDEPAGVPSTPEASYEPVSDPTERAPGR